MVQFGKKRKAPEKKKASIPRTPKSQERSWGQSKENYVKYIQRGSVQEERREAPAKLGKDQEGQKKSALPLPPRQPDSLTGPEEAEGSPWGPSDRKDHSEMQ